MMNEHTQGRDVPKRQVERKARVMCPSHNNTKG